MKLFISWSGELSHCVAVILRAWLRLVIQSVEPYVSSQDIEKGARRSDDVARRREECDFAIICVTSENRADQWIAFDAGAVSKPVQRARVVPFLIDVSPSDLEGPLAQFQATTIQRADVKKLLLTINKSAGDDALADNVIEKSFTKWWPELKTRLEKAISEAKKRGVTTVKRRSDRELLEEILKTVQLPRRS